MNVNVTDVKVGNGLGDVLFGINKEKLKYLLGEPDEIDTYNASGDEDEFLTETWHYDEYEFSVSFDEEDNWRLTTFSISSPDCNINGHQLIGKKLDDVIKILDAENFGDNELENLSDDNNEHKLISYVSSSLNLWFENNLLSEIQWGVLWTDEDTPKWPE
jgi:hypothetical protein